MVEARFWESAEGNRVRCSLCRFRCLIADGRRGICGVRENRDGRLYTLVYGHSIAESVDPIEKKPLFHYYPGSRSLSIATVGCNFRCLHCQNFEIARQPRPGEPIPGRKLAPEELVERAVAAGCRSISYTYTEPTIFLEYAYDTAVLARKAGIGNVFVTNGYITPEALESVAPYLDAANIDLKGFTEKFYREVAGSTLAGVLDSLRLYREHGIWVEVTTLLIPGLNDDPAELKEIARFIAGELGVEVPWHVTGFYPTHKLRDRPPTPVATLREARRIGLEAGLRYVYEGNVPGEGGENTFCPGCGAAVIERVGFRLGRTALSDGACRACGQRIDGIGLP